MRRFQLSFADCKIGCRAHVLWNRNRGFKAFRPASRKILVIEKTSIYDLDCQDSKVSLLIDRAWFEHSPRGLIVCVWDYQGGFATYRCLPLRVIFCSFRWALFSDRST